MSSLVCLCGKKKLNLNDINWKRHVTSCKIIKLKNTNSGNVLSNYFSQKRENKSLFDGNDGIILKKGKSLSTKSILFII